VGKRTPPNWQSWRVDACAPRFLGEARQAAEAFLRTDPKLERPESRAVRAVLVHRWAGRLELAEIG